MERVIGTFVGMAIAGVVILLFGESEEATRKKEAELRNQRAAQKEAERLKQEKQEKQRKVIQVRSKAHNNFKLGKEDWDAAWEFERNGESENANRKFKSAEAKFAQAVFLDPDNVQYAKYSKMTKCKNDGNSTYNEGLQLHKEGNRLMNMGKYSEALRKYIQAKTYFKMGAQEQEMESWRFTDCIDFVKEAIYSLKGVIQNLESMEQKRVLQEMIQVVNDETDQEVAFEELNNDVVFEYLSDSFQ